METKPSPCDESNEGRITDARTSSVWRLGIPFELGLGAVACLIGAFAGIHPWQNLRWSWIDFGRGAAAALPMLACFAILVRWKTPAVERIHRMLTSFLREFADRASIASLGCLSAAAGLGEELLFRGLIQPALSAPLGDNVGLLLASAAFGLLHPLTFTYVLFVFVIGVYLGWLYLATGNLLCPAVAHGLYDWCALVWYVRFASRAAREPDGDLQGL
jgi:membrane protease YdiL (CAAX protease family)